MVCIMAIYVNKIAQTERTSSSPSYAFNTQYVRNLNPGNYFEVYRNSFNRLENIAVNSYNSPPEFITNDNGTDELIRSKADEFIDLVLQDSGFENTNSDDYKTVNNIKERKDRLTEDNLIFATSFSYVKDTLIGHDSIELLEGEWVTSEYGFPPITISTPKVLKHIETKSTLNVRVLVTPPILTDF